MWGILKIPHTPLCKAAISDILPAEANDIRKAVFRSCFVRSLQSIPIEAALSSTFAKDHLISLGGSLGLRLEQDFGIRLNRPWFSWILNPTCTGTVIADLIELIVDAAKPLSCKDLKNEIQKSIVIASGLWVQT